MFLSHRRGTTVPPPAPYGAFVSEVKASWSTIIFLVAAQCLGTLCANIAGSPLPHEATNTDFLYNHHISLFLLVFVTFKANSVFGSLLALYNATLLTALLGWPQAWHPKLSQKHLLTHGVSIVGIVCMRVLFGYIFGRGTGFAYPLLFFNDAIHETTCGLSVIILYCITRRAYLNTTNERSGANKFLLTSLFLWLPNTIHGPVFFWSFSTACVTGIQGLLPLLFENREPAWARHNDKTPSRLARFLAMLWIFFLLSTIFALISFIHSVTYRDSHNTHAQLISSLPDPVLTEFLILSYPRRNDSALLSSTLQSYAPGLGSRFNAKVYTTVEPASHPAFSDAQRTFRESPGIHFFPDPNPLPLLLSRPVVPGYLPSKQTLDLYSALSWAERNVQANATRYLGIMEDDFEWCKDGWDEWKAVLYEVSLQEVSKPSQGRFCGVFVATGGSGLLIRPSIIPLLRDALQRYAFDFNTDIILQDCLRGALPLCAECKLAASRRLLFRHTGASQSTYDGRFYPEDRWQCGWRQPFNGKPGVWVP